LSEFAEMFNWEALLKWAVIGLIAIVSLIIVGLIFAFQPLVIYLVAGIVAAFVLRYMKIEPLYSFVAFMFIVLLGFLVIYVV
jgi:hypothetical protein